MIRFDGELTKRNLKPDLERTATLNLWLGNYLICYTRLPNRKFRACDN
jgi:hypothetical protein